MRARKAFTLVEILIVVVILGILAAIVVPQFTSASEDAQISNVQSQLQTVRNQIELYRVRNNGQLPDFANNGWDDIVTSEYLRSEPINPRTGVATIVVQAGGPAADDAFGWIWNTTDGELQAARFDEDNGAWLD
jgi:prepilin-type N-terminal cleavage/methylation domain-containing protein